MSEAWVYMLSGIGFCLAGIFLFQRTAFEENKKVWRPLLLILGGVALLSVGMAKSLHLVD